LVGASIVRSGRAVVGETRDHEQMDRPRILEILEPAWAHRDELGPVRGHAANAFARGLRDRDLPAVRRGRDARGVVDVDPDVVPAVIRRSPCAGVQAHPKAKDLAVDRRQRGDRPADGDGRFYRSRRLRECRERPVALVLDDDPASGLHRRIHDGIVLSQEGRRTARARAVGRAASNPRCR